MTQYSVLLLFKDDLSIGGKDEFPITIKSETIKQHQCILQGIVDDNLNNDNKEQFLFQFEDSENSILRRAEVNEIDDKNFVWGWWKKPGESHNNLFKKIESICKNGEVVNALLYNRYLRRIYNAEITDIYYVPYASTVTIPHKWLLKCPEYYRNLPHFCGAYFSMRLISISKDNINEFEEYDNNIKIYYDDPQIILKKYFVDKDTFDETFLNNLSVIMQTEGIIDESHKIIDKEIFPLSLKLTDQTIFLLRKSTKKEKIRELFNNQDDEINNEFINLPINDAIDFIKSMTRQDWKKLFSLEKTITVMNELFKNTDMPITATDIKLVSNLIMENILVSSSSISNELSDIEKSIIEWLLSGDFKIQRENASSFFSLAWKKAIKKIELPSLDQYFKILPRLEEILSSTKHIRQKLYRDHLNHNIRAAMMSSYLVYNINHNHEDMRLSFFSGLLHDIAYPVSSYEATIQSIQESFANLNVTEAAASNSIIIKDNLKNWVNTIAFISSIPYIKDNEIPQPFNNLDTLFDKIDPRLLYEEIMCSMSCDHSFLSAVVILNAVVNKVLEKDDTFNDGVKRLITKQNDYKDLFQIIQCIALHDRKASIDYKGINNFQQLTIINMKDFFLPVITIIADEIQEWGRPISSNEKSIVTDCSIDYDNGNFIIKYLCNFKKEILKEIKYCFLEHFYSKIRIFSRLKNEKNNIIKLKLNIIIENGLEIYIGNTNNGELKFKFKENDIIWPENDVRPDRIKEESNKRLFAFISYLSDNKNIISSIIILESNNADIINNIRKHLQKNTLNIKNFIISNDLCKLIINNNISIEGNINTYFFTTYDKSSFIGIPDKYEILEEVGILYLKDVLTSNIEEITSVHIHTEDNDLHLKPQPHFLDLDWRFSYKSINSILKFVSANISSGKVCYLGCPSLALYHNKRIEKKDVEFTLFDKGHYALKKWMKDGYIYEKNYKEYDVYSEIDNEYLHKYSMVIIDPPWYKDFYEMFLRRAMAFVKENGIIGIVEYPGYPGKDKKISEFRTIRKKLFKSSNDLSPFCSIEVAYNEPDFEKIWHEHIKYIHSAIGTYRPAYMDFYLISNTVSIKSEDVTLPNFDKYNEINIEYTNGYVRLKEDFNKYFNNEYYWTFTTYKSLKRITNNSQWIGWSTNNTIINVNSEKGEKINNQEELLKYLEKYEK
jgi:hypothetical protein